ncbi:MAG: hypothetical protein GKR98_00490 [Boseongicola sp.]|nr:MAG: hypothetical protein GKR98_00490 [Boseongicola sp.]
MRLGVIGCGTIARPAVEGIACDVHQITVSEQSSSHSKALAAAYDNISVADNQGVVDASDLIFLGLIAEDAPKVLREAKFRDDQKIVSFIAAATLEQAGAMTRPAPAVAIMMPFPSITRGGTPIMVQGDTALVGEIVGDHNSVFSLKDAKEMA